MEEIFITFGLIAAVGNVARPLVSGAMNPDLLRQGLNTAVLYILLPAQIFEKVFGAEIASDSYQVPAAMAGGIVCSLLLGAFLLGFLKIEGPVKGGLVLACAFGSAGCLGLPVVQEMFGSQGVPVVFFADAAVTTLNLVLGVVLVSIFVSGRGTSRSIVRSIGSVLALPPIWALAGALALNLQAIALPSWVLSTAETLGSGVTVLLLLSLGMSLRLPRPKSLVPVIPVLLIKLILSPLAVYLVARGFGMSGAPLEATVVEGAMPTQLLCLVIADRFGLDLSDLALVIVIDTALAYLTIPLIHGLLF